MCSKHFTDYYFFREESTELKPKFVGIRFDIHFTVSKKSAVKSSRTPEQIFAEGFLLTGVQNGKTYQEGSERGSWSSQSYTCKISKTWFSKYSRSKPTVSFYFMCSLINR